MRHNVRGGSGDAIRSRLGGANPKPPALSSKRPATANASHHAQPAGSRAPLLRSPSTTPAPGPHAHPPPPRAGPAVPALPSPSLLTS